MKEVEVTLTKTKTTKNTVVYEYFGDNKQPAVTRLYVQRNALPDVHPAQIVVSVRGVKGSDE